MINETKSLKQVVQEINKKLTPDIRIHSIIQTYPSFNAKGGAVSREYEYIMPTFLFNDFGDINFKNKIYGKGKLY
jgi:tRNA U38,U39,U40 pseudouridine synthase TruA